MFVSLNNKIDVNLYMPQVGFEPETYGILSTWNWDSALEHSATTAGWIKDLLYLEKVRSINSVLSKSSAFKTKTFPMDSIDF